MKDLYFISVLGSLHTFCVLSAILLLVILVCLFIWYMCTLDESNMDRPPKSSFVLCTVWIFIFSVFSILIPTSKELYYIYGIGSAIDYVKDNPEARELPDKTIKCLNVLADRYISDITSEDVENKDTTRVNK